MIACAIGLYAWGLGVTKWKIGTFLLFLLGVDVVLIAEHNQYAGRERVGASIHRRVRIRSCCTICSPNVIAGIGITQAW